MGQPTIAVHRERPIAAISDDEVGRFDLNVAVESNDFPQRVTTTFDRSEAVNSDRSEEYSLDQYVTQNDSAECATIISRDQQGMAESRGVTRMWNCN
nr:unnamed protein product [Digitaria exilis]